VMGYPVLSAIMLKVCEISILNDDSERERNLSFTTDESIS